MRFTKLAMSVVFSAAVLLPSGSALAGAVTPPVLNGFFIFQDASQTTNNCSFHDYDSDQFGVDGEVTGVASTGETVTVFYDAEFIDKVGVKSDKGSVGAKERSFVELQIDDGLAVTTFDGNPDKCRVQGKMKNPSSGSDVARVSVTCEVGENGTALTPTPTAAEITIIQSAFDGRKDIGLKGKNLKIKQKGEEVVACP